MSFLRNGVKHLSEELKSEFYQEIKTLLPETTDFDTKFKYFTAFWMSLDEKTKEENFQDALQVCMDKNGQIDIYKLRNIWELSDKNIREQKKNEFIDATTSVIFTILKDSNSDMDTNKLNSAVMFAKELDFDLTEEIMNEFLKNKVCFGECWPNMSDSIKSKYLIKAMKSNKELIPNILNGAGSTILLEKFDELDSQDLGLSEFPESEKYIKILYLEKLRQLSPEERKVRHEQDREKIIDAIKRKYGLNPNETISNQIRNYDIEDVNIILKLDEKGTINFFNCDTIIKAIPILGEEIITRTYQSNSEMLSRNANQIVARICDKAVTTNKQEAFEMLDNIEDVFSKDYLPSFYKIYKYFDDVVNKDNTIFNRLDGEKMLSPVLKNAESDSLRKRIIFSDLLKISMNSNNKSFRDFLDTLEKGNKIYVDIMKNGMQYENLHSEEKMIFTNFTRVLQTLYHESGTYSRDEREDRKILFTGNIVEDAKSLGKRYSVDGKIEDLPDRVLKTYIGPYQEFFSGITTVAQMREYIDKKTKESNEIHRELATKKIDFHTGDMVKGIQGFNMEILKSILQDGVVAGEFLGINYHSDVTPLDTDFGMYVDADDLKDKSIMEKIGTTPAKGYGEMQGVYIIFKNNPNRREYTRVHKDTSQEVKTKDETMATRIANKKNPTETRKFRNIRSTGEYRRFKI